MSERLIGLNVARYSNFVGMLVVKKKERANAFNEVRRFCKELGFIAGMLEGALAEGCKK